MNKTVMNIGLQILTPLRCAFMHVARLLSHLLRQLVFFGCLALAAQSRAVELPLAVSPSRVAPGATITLTVSGIQAGPQCAAWGRGPYLTCAVDTPGSASGAVLVGNYPYAADRDRGLEIVSAFSPLATTLLNSSKLTELAPTHLQVGIQDATVTNPDGMIYWARNALTLSSVGVKDCVAVIGSLVSGSYLNSVAVNLSGTVTDAGHQSVIQAVTKNGTELCATCPTDEVSQRAGGNGKNDYWYSRCPVE